MAIGFATYERPFGIRDAGGLVYYESAAFITGILEVDNVDSATIGRGEAVIIDSAGSIFPRWDYATTGVDVTFSTKCKVGVKRISALTNKNLYGVALENIPAATVGRVCTAGSVTAVKCLTTLTSVVEGAPVIGSATAGSCDTLAPGLAAAATQTFGDGTVLGNMCVRNGTAAGQSGSTAQLIAIISPH